MVGIDTLVRESLKRNDALWIDGETKLVLSDVFDMSLCNWHAALGCFCALWLVLPVVCVLPVFLWLV